MNILKIFSFSLHIFLLFLRLFLILVRCSFFFPLIDPVNIIIFDELVHIVIVCLCNFNVVLVESIWILGSLLIWLMEMLLFFSWDLSCLDYFLNQRIWLLFIHLWKRGEGGWICLFLRTFVSIWWNRMRSLRFIMSIFYLYWRCSIILFLVDLNSSLFIMPFSLFFWKMW